MTVLVGNPCLYVENMSWILLMKTIKMLDPLLQHSFCFLHLLLFLFYFPQTASSMFYAADAVRTLRHNSCVERERVMAAILVFRHKVEIEKTTSCTSSLADSTTTRTTAILSLVVSQGTPVERVDKVMVGCGLTYLTQAINLGSLPAAQNCVFTPRYRNITDSTQKFCFNNQNLQFYFSSDFFLQLSLQPSYKLY